MQHLASLGCNVTFERVDVETTFVGSDLQIDTSPGKSPRIREDTARLSAMDPQLNSSIGPVSSIYSSLAKIQTDPQLLEPFFGMLVSSRFAIPMSDLGDAGADQKVADAIKWQHGVIHAQNLAQQRIPAQWSNVTLASIASRNDSDAQPRYTAAVTDTSARRRVVQDAASTQALEALLGAALVLLVVGWLFMHQTDVLPRPPTSIASVAALVAGGNVLDKLPADAEWRTRAELAAALRASSGGGGIAGIGGEPRFWLGWGLVPDLEGRAAGTENENGYRRFGIFAVGEEESIPVDDGGKGGKMDQERRMQEQVTAYDGAAGGSSQYAPIGQGAVAYNIS